MQFFSTCSHKHSSTHTYDYLLRKGLFKRVIPGSDFRAMLLIKISTCVVKSGRVVFKEQPHFGETVFFERSFDFFSMRKIVSFNFLRISEKCRFPEIHHNPQI